MELAPQMGISALEADILLEEIVEADEAFLTNSVVEIMSVTELDGKAIGDGGSGVITRRLMSGCKDLVLRETRHQLKS